jgi:hypothetical protein
VLTNLVTSKVRNVTAIRSVPWGGTDRRTDTLKLIFIFLKRFEKAQNKLWSAATWIAYKITIVRSCEYIFSELWVVQTNDSGGNYVLHFTIDFILSNLRTHIKFW